jgi:hypothetical protein
VATYAPALPLLERVMDRWLAHRTGGYSPKSSWLSARRVVVLCSGVGLLLYLTACCLFYFQAALAPAGATRGLRAGEIDPEAAEKAQIRAELGRGTWNMLHRAAAQFEKAPTAQQRGDMEQFFTRLGQFYPCPECAAHFREMLAEYPIDTRSNSHLSLWLCKLHNVVNARLAKPQFACELAALKDRWGSCGCFGDADNSTAPAVPASAAIG